MSHRHNEEGRSRRNRYFTPIIIVIGVLYQYSEFTLLRILHELESWFVRDSTETTVIDVFRTLVPTESFHLFRSRVCGKDFTHSQLKNHIVFTKGEESLHGVGMVRVTDFSRSTVVLT